MAEPSDDLLRVAVQYVGPMREAWLQAIRNTLSSVPESSIVSALAEEGYNVSKALSNPDQLADILGAYIADDVVPIMTDVWWASGRKVSSVLPKGALVAPFSFDTARVSAVSSAGGYRAAFVTEVTEAQRETISQVINRGLIEGRSRAQVARDIRASIGLTASQETWIENYRRQLLTMDPGALDRALRDHRSDRLFERLVNSGDMLTTDQIDSMVERYRQRMVKWRAETIARTEALRAMRMGEWEGLMAADEAGALSKLLRKFWIDAKDERERAQHIPIPGMNPDGRAIDEPFQTPLGLMMYPLDPNGSARNVVNCRCRLAYRMPSASGEYQDIPIRGHLPADVASELGDLNA